MSPIKKSQGETKLHTVLFNKVTQGCDVILSILFRHQKRKVDHVDITLVLYF